MGSAPDPYDITRVWVRDHPAGGGWITAYWKLLGGKPAPFGELAWDHALADLRRQGRSPSEPEIAQAAQDLMARAHAGPATRAGRAAGPRPTPRERRVAAITDAARPSLPPGPATSQDSRPEVAPPSDAPGDAAASPARVVPLRVFDARKEARRDGRPARQFTFPDDELRRPPTTLEGWRAFVDATPAELELLPEDEWAALDDAERLAYDEARMNYHSEMLVVETSAVTKIAKQGRLLTIINRRETGARRGMIVSGPWTTGKSTAIKQFGRMHELRIREMHPGAQRIPVVYVTTPPKGSPRKLAAEFARFLGLGPIKPRHNVTDIADAVCQILVQEHCDVVLVDEIHNLNNATSAGEDLSDHLKYFTEHIPATFVYAGINVESSGLFTGARGKQIGRPLRADQHQLLPLPRRMAQPRGDAGGRAAPAPPRPAPCCSTPATCTPAPAG